MSNSAETAFTADNPVLGHPAVKREAQKLSRTPAQIALAWTLSIGVVTSVFSAVLVTQVLLAWWFRATRPKTLPIS